MSQPHSSFRSTGFLFLVLKSDNSLGAFGFSPAPGLLLRHSKTKCGKRSTGLKRGQCLAFLPTFFCGRNHLVAYNKWGEFTPKWPKSPCFVGSHRLGAVKSLGVLLCQFLYSCVGVFNWCHLSSPPQILLRPG